MKIILVLSDLIVPLTFVLIIAYGYSTKTKIYDSFIEGAKDGFTTILTIMPTLIGLMVAVGILRASGALDIFSNSIKPLTDAVNYPISAVPITFMRLVSSSASIGLLLDIFKEYGVDSFEGRFVSVMMSCTETVFYTMSIYFMSVKVTKTKYTLPVALIANFFGVVASLFITELVFGR